MCSLLFICHLTSFLFCFFVCTCVSRDVFHVPSLLIVGTTTAVVLINCNTWEPLYVLDFRGEWCSKFSWFIAKNNISSSRKSSSSHHVSFLEPVLSSSELENVQYTISTAGSFAFMKHKNNNVRFALLLFNYYNYYNYSIIIEIIIIIIVVISLLVSSDLMSYWQLISQHSEHCKCQNSNFQWTKRWVQSWGLQNNSIKPWFLFIYLFIYYSHIYPALINWHARLRCRSSRSKA